MARRSENVKKLMCLKVVDRDINLSLREDLSMEEVAKMAKKVLVGQVRGKNYIVERIRLWTKEIWGTLLKELPPFGFSREGGSPLDFTGRSTHIIYS